MDDVPLQEGDIVGQIRKSQHLMILRELFPFFPTKKTAEPNLVISIVFLVVLGF